MSSSPITGVLRFLRSRRLAVALILVLALYGVVGTLVPQGAPGDSAVRAWAASHPVAESAASLVGLHRAYASPPFVAFGALLALSTAACAVERTQHALRLMRRLSRRPGELAETLTTEPQFTLPVAAGRHPDDALSAALTALRELGLRPTRDGASASATSGHLGPLGSPVFHWSIVALILVIAAGQATRAEGVIGLPVGERVADARASYFSLAEGPLFAGRFTGMELEAFDVARHQVVDGVDFGPSPLVAAYRGGVEVARGRVYPNNPLRVGPLLVHMVEFGPAATFALEGPAGERITRETFMLVLSADTSSGTMPQTFELSGADGKAGIAARIQVIVRRASEATGSAPAVSRALVETSTAGASVFGSPTVLQVGDALPLPGGGTLRLEDVKDWASVSVANDWSVTPIYVLFCVAIAALAVAVLVPARRVAVMLVETDSGWSLHADTWHSRKDPTFRPRVEQILRDAAGVQEDE
jgi:hypothetical protein